MVQLPFGITIGREKAPLSQANTVPPGPFDQRRGDPEVGAPGTVYYSGFLDSEEYNHDLRGEKAISTYTKMLADGTVQAMVRAIVLPIRSATPRFEPASADAQDVAIADACEEVLLNMEGQRWDDFIRQAFTGALVFGHAAFEQVWTKPGELDENGKPTYQPNFVAHEGKQLIAPYKLAPRLQKTLYRWLIDRDGELLGVQQRVWSGTVPPGTQVDPGEHWPVTPSGTYRYITIPADRLFLFVLEQEGANFLGRSILRAAYKHWYYKEAHLRIAALAAERQGVGVPYAITKQGIQPSETAALVNALRALHAHEKAYLIANEAQLADAGKTGMDSIGIMNMAASGTEKVDVMILYHDRQMAVSVLADFLTLGSGQGGNANVMHRDKTSMFYESLLGIKKPFEDNFQKTVVEPFVRLNWGENAKAPHFHLTGMEAKDLESRGRGLAALFLAKALTPTPETENQLREEMDLPLLDEGPDGEPVYPDVTPPGTPGPTTPMDVGRIPPAGSPLPQEPPEVTHRDPANLAEEIAAIVLAKLGELPNPKAPAAKRLASPPQIAAAAVAVALLAARKLHAQVVDEMGSNADRLVDGQDDYGVDDYSRDGTHLIRNAAASMFAAGFLAQGKRSEGDRITAAATPGRATPEPVALDAARDAWATSVAAEAAPFVLKTAQELTAGEITRDEADTNAAAQAGVIWTSVFRGEAAALGDQFRVVWHAESDGEVCALCDPRDGQEYDQDTLPGYPGEGGFGDICEGGPNCRCELEFLEDDPADAEMSEPRILAEARCPKGHWCGRNVNAGAVLYCKSPQCRKEWVVTL